MLGMTGLQGTFSSIQQTLPPPLPALPLQQSACLTTLPCRLSLLLCYDRGACCACQTIQPPLPPTQLRQRPMQRPCCLSCQLCYEPTTAARLSDDPAATSATSSATSHACVGDQLSSCQTTRSPLCYNSGARLARLPDKPAASATCSDTIPSFISNRQRQAKGM